jgi:hypothetical protein
MARYFHPCAGGPEAHEQLSLKRVRDLEMDRERGREVQTAESELRKGLRGRDRDLEIDTETDQKSQTPSPEECVIQEPAAAECDCELYFAM